MTRFDAILFLVECAVMALFLPLHLWYLLAAKGIFTANLAAHRRLRIMKGTMTWGKVALSARSRGV